MKEYDVNKNYKWKEDDEFIVRGSTINLFNLLIRMETAKDEYKRMVIYQKAQELMKEVFSNNIDKLEEMEEKK